MMPLRLLLLLLLLRNRNMSPQATHFGVSVLLMRLSANVSVSMGTLWVKYVHLDENSRFVFES